MKDYDEFDRDLVYFKDQKRDFVAKHYRHVARFRLPRILHLTNNHLKNMLRDRIQVIFIIGFPILFMLLFSMQIESVSHISYNLIIINHDVEGAGEPGSIDYLSKAGGSDAFIQALNYDEFKDYVKIIGTNNYTLLEAIQALNTEKCHGIIIIEQNFTEKIIGSEVTGQPEIEVKTIDDKIAYEVITQVTTQIVNSMIILYKGGNPTSLEIDSDLNLQTFTFFDVFLPPILVASILICISQVATHFAGEKETGTMRRLSTTAVSRSQILISGALSQFMITAFQVTIMLTLGMLIGAYVHPNANWLLIFMVLALVTFSALGLGLLLASFLKTYNQAGLFAWFIILPLLFLGGIFTWGAEYQYSYFFPTYWASYVLRMIMLYALDSWDIIGFGVTYLIIFTLIVTTIGILLFQRKKAILS
ncbi:MAG: ABC transporter permease [Promethearchaeota archaeon]